MAQINIEWPVVKDIKTLRPIGCLGYIDGTIVAVGAFYDGRDTNFDGKVSLRERLAIGSGSTQTKIMPLFSVVSNAIASLKLEDDAATLIQLQNILGMQVVLAPLMDLGFITAKAVASMTVGAAIARRIPAGAVVQFLVRQAFGRQVDNYFKAVVLPAAGSHSGLQFDGGLIGPSS